jgi:hypothetical protein
MREATPLDKKIAKKKHFKKGDLVQIRVFEHTNHETGEKEEKTFVHVILEKTHLYNGKNGTHYKVWDIGEGVEKNEIYLHDIPEEKAEVKLSGKADESATTKSIRKVVRQRNSINNRSDVESSK